MDFEWDIKKVNKNLKKHGVSFVEASTALKDCFSLTVPDPDHSLGESRYITFGLSYLNRLLVVSHTERNCVLRIISARVATKNEIRLYEEY